MNWNNVNLSEDSSEREANLIDGLTFDTLLLEIHCNIKDINAETITKQFNDDLNNRIEEAKSIFNSNLNNIINQAKKERAIK